MKEKSEALRLADALEEKEYPPRRAAAAELRRLHALNAQLLEALEHALVWNEDASPEPAWVTEARAAIAAAMGQA